MFQKFKEAQDLNSDLTTVSLWELSVLYTKLIETKAKLVATTEANTYPVRVL